jgi:ABC-type molybdenum transport system ATPase subunit/photorepair protein PhrA
MSPETRKTIYIGERLLALEGADIGYGEQGKPILENIDLVVNRGMKLILRGPNGAGKYAPSSGCKMSHWSLAHTK